MMHMFVVPFRQRRILLAAAKCALPGLWLNLAHWIVAVAMSGRVESAAQLTLPTMGLKRLWQVSLSSNSDGVEGQPFDVSLSL